MIRKLSCLRKVHNYEFVNFEEGRLLFRSESWWSKLTRSRESRFPWNIWRGCQPRKMSVKISWVY